MNYYFNLVPPFYFLKNEISIFQPANENSPDSSCHFWKQKSVFLQILHQFSMPISIALLYFFSLNIIYFDQKEVIKVHIFRLSRAQVKIHQIPHVNFETESQFLFKFCIILHCRDTCLPFKLLTHTFSTLD